MFLNCSRSWLRGAPLPCTSRFIFCLTKKPSISRGEQLHRAITGQEDKGAPLRVLDKARDPFREAGVSPARF